MSKSGNIHILLVRTGATEWDDAGRVQGDTDLPMSESGRQRLVQSLGSYLRDTAGSAWSSFDAVLHAPDEASRQTAKFVAGEVQSKTRENEGLKAVDMGLWEGLREAELLERHPTAYRQWIEDPGAVIPPEGEGIQEAEQRLLGALRRGLARKSSAAVVLRPPAFGVLRCWLLNRPLADLWKTLENAPQAELFVIEKSRLKGVPAEQHTRA